MKNNKTTILTAAVFACAFNLHAAVQISDFGTGPLAVDWTYTPASSLLTGSANDSGSLSESSLSIDISGNTQISITANSISDSTGLGNFLLQLLDNSFDSVSATFSFEEFVGGATVVKSLSTNAAFDPSNVNAWAMVAAGSSDYSPNITLTNLSAVPEPTVAMLVGLAGLAGVALRRRRIS